MKDPRVASFSPMFHWTEHNIVVHVFTCVLALQLAHLMRRRAAQAGLHLSRPHPARRKVRGRRRDRPALSRRPGQAQGPPHAHRHHPRPGQAHEVLRARPLRSRSADMGNTQPSPYTHADQRKHGEDQLIQESQASTARPATTAGVAAVDNLPTTSGASTAPTHGRRGRVPRECLTLSLLILHDAATGCAGPAPSEPHPIYAIREYFAGFQTRRVLPCPGVRTVRPTGT